MALILHPEQWVQAHANGGAQLCDPVYGSPLLPNELPRSFAENGSPFYDADMVRGYDLMRHYGGRLAIAAFFTMQDRASDLGDAGMLTAMAIRSDIALFADETDAVYAEEAEDPGFRERLHHVLGNVSKLSIGWDALEGPADELLLQTAELVEPLLAEGADVGMYGDLVWAHMHEMGMFARAGRLLSQYVDFDGLPTTQRLNVLSVMHLHRTGMAAKFSFTGAEVNSNKIVTAHTPEAANDEIYADVLSGCVIRPELLESFK